MNLLHILANDGFICVNKHIIKKLGLGEAILIGELASIYTYNSNKGSLEDDWFYATIEKIQENTGLSEYKQQQIITNLCDLGLLEQKLQGVPRKRFLKFNTEKLYEMVLNEEEKPLPKIRETVPKNSGDSSQILPELAPKNSGDIYNNINNNKDNNRDNTQGESSSNTNILEENIKNQSESRKILTPTRVKAPKVSVLDRVPKKLLDKLILWDNYPDTKQALVNYILFLIDTYNDPVSSIKNKITQICRMASNTPKGIEIICNYNIDRNYRTVYKPSDYKKQMSDAPVESEEYKGDFVRDENGEVEEIW